MGIQFYLKAVAAAVVAVGAGLAVALDSGGVSSLEWVTLALAALGSSGVVWYVANGPQAVYAKAVVGALTAALASLAVALGDEVVTQSEWVTAVVAGVVGLGVVAAVPNVKKPVA